MKNKYRLIKIITGKMRIILASAVFFFLTLTVGAQRVFIPAAGNGWAINPNQVKDMVITKTGIKNWSDPETTIKIWFWTSSTGEFTIRLPLKVNSAKSEVFVNFENQQKTIVLQNVTTDTISLGKFHINRPGYHYIEFRGVKKSGEYFAEIPGIILEGSVTSGKMNFVRDDFYFGRRGPSVHLRYQISSEVAEAVWFYNEITIPKGEDVIGSYFMANGFSDGYFGIQVNSPTERRILFSVWSPYKTDNPGDIPDEFKIILLKKGKEVITGEFGNEGSGGQSFKRYNWKAGTTYRFLLKGIPSVNGSTDYTAWFFAPENDKWELIASFRRPKTTSHLKNLYSFLENFDPETGYIARKGYYSNQWILDTNNKWHEITVAKFTADATARKDARMDYSGGTENGKFYLRNCGFFDDSVKTDQTFTRAAGGTPPVIDFKNLNSYK